MTDRIVFVTETEEVGGAEIVMQQVVGCFRERATVIVPRSGRLSARLQSAGIETVVVPHPRFVSTSRFVMGRRMPSLVGLVLSLFTALLWTIRLTHYFRHSDDAWVHSVSTWSHLCAGIAGRVCNKRVVWHYHSIIRPNAGFGLYRWCINVAARFIPDHIVAVSAEIKAQFNPSIPVTIITPAIDPQRFTLGKTKSETFTIGTVGRFTEWKGQHIALESARQLKQHGIAFKWVMVGDTSLGSDAYRQRLIHFVDRHKLSDQVTFKPWIEDAAQLYREFDVLVHVPTEPEPFGMVVAEALTSGLPVITTSGGAAPYVLQAGGTCVQAGTWDAITAQLVAWHDAPAIRAQVSRSSRLVAVGLFAPRTINQQWKMIYGSRT